MGGGDLDLAGLADRWVDQVVVRSRSHDTEALARTRRGDLCRWAAAWQARPRPYDFDELLGGMDRDALSTPGVERAARLLRVSYSPATVARTLSSVRSFSRWLVRRGVLDADPFELGEIVIPPAPQDQDLDPVFALSAEQVAKIRTAAALSAPRAHSAWPARDVAIVEMLAGCGLRASELAALQCRDLDEQGEYPVLKVVRAVKGRGRRVVPVPRPALAAVRTWEQARTERFGPPTSAEARLFLRRNGRPVDRLFLYRLVERLAARCEVGLPGDAVVHAFRHHYGVELARRGVPLSVIQELLGHRDPRTTAIYTRMAARHLTEALDDAGWL